MLAISRASCSRVVSSRIDRIAQVLEPVDALVGFFECNLKLGRERGMRAALSSRPVVRSRGVRGPTQLASRLLPSGVRWQLPTELQYREREYTSTLIKSHGGIAAVRARWMPLWKSGFPSVLKTRCSFLPTYPLCPLHFSTFPLYFELCTCHRRMAALSCACVGGPCGSRHIWRCLRGRSCLERFPSPRTTARQASTRRRSTRSRAK